MKAKTVYVVQRSPQATDGERRWFDASIMYPTKAEAMDYRKRVKPLFSVSKFRIIRRIESVIE